MQQTDKYQLNLIESSDTFSPAPLNENAQKLEAALADGLTGEAAARAAADAALDQRVQALEVHKFVVGYHTGSGFVDLGATPLAVAVHGVSGGHNLVGQGNGMSGLNIVEGGFTCSATYGNCTYVAFY